MSVSIGCCYTIQDLNYPTSQSPGTGKTLTPVWTAPSLANAQAVAQVYSTLFQRQIRLVPLGPPNNAPPYQIFSPSASMALSTAPSSISF
jgi:hypothetical protein